MLFFVLTHFEAAKSGQNYLERRLVPAFQRDPLATMSRRLVGGDGQQALWCHIQVFLGNGHHRSKIFMSAMASLAMVRIDLAVNDAK